MKRLLLVIGTVALVAIILTGILLSGPRIEASNGTLSIGISISNPLDASNITATTIGDTQPSIKFACWNNESYISIVPAASKTYSKSNIGNDIKFSDTSNAIDYEFKPTPVDLKFNELGGQDIIITLKSNPGTNVLQFTYDSKAAIAMPQPPLTDSYKVGDNDGGRVITSVNETEVRWERGLIARMPDYCVNSIVFIRSSGTPIYSSQAEADKYGIGGIGMLYRMKAFDTKGNWTWADWGINNGFITLTIDQKIIDTAVYPITIKPAGDTFGYTTTTKSGQNWPGPTQFVCYSGTYNGTAGTGTSMSAYINDERATSNQFALYDSSSPTARKGYTVTVNTAGIDGLDKWITANFNGATTIEAIPYHLVYSSTDNISDSLPIWRFNNGNRYYKNSMTFGTWPATITWSSDGTNKWEYLIYCTYTAGGTPSLTNSPTSKDMGTVYPDGRTVYAKGNAPGNPVETGNCTFIITNNGSITGNITASMTNMTGGTSWNITSSSPGANTFRMTAYYAGQNPAYGLVLLTTAQAFYNELAASANISWDFKLEMPTSSTDTTQKTGTLQLTAISP